MSRSRATFLAFAALGFFMGGGMGWMIRGAVEPTVTARGAVVQGAPTASAVARADSPPPATDAALTKSIQAGVLKDLREENEELRRRLERMELKAAGERTAPAGALSLADLNLDGLGSSGRSLNPQLIAYLGVKPEAAEQINRQLDLLISETERRLRDGAQVESSSPEKVVIKAPAFPEAVEAMNQRLEATVRGATEGEQTEQLLYFIERSRNQPRGRSDFTLSYEKVTGADGVPMLRITRPLDSGGIVATQATMTPEIRGDASVRQTDIFLPLLPPGFLP